MNKKILNWNANSIKRRKNELQDFLQTEEINIVLITETHLRNSYRFNILNYKSYRNDREKKTEGGVAILTKRNIYHHPLPNPQHNENIVATGTKITAHNTQQMEIYATYIPPNRLLDEKRINQIINNNENSTQLLGGDLDAKNTTWKCKK